MTTPKTITTFLVDGSPSGIKTVELSNWSGKAIVIPRAKLKDSKTRIEVQNTALYFLFGEDEQGNNLAYIGEAENLLNRIINHDTNKDFWESMIGFISKDNSLMKGDVKYLESLAITRAKRNGLYILQNSTTPPQNNLTEYRMAEMNEFLENIDLLISTIGYPILKEISKSSSEVGNNLYYLKNRGSDATGIYRDDGFLVLKGSRGPKSMVDSMIKDRGYAYRNRPILIEKGIIIEEVENIIFLKDYIFNSPGAASDLLTGRSTNGWLLWKNKDGKTLDEIERKQLLNY